MAIIKIKNLFGKIHVFEIKTNLNQIQDCSIRKSPIV